MKYKTGDKVKIKTWEKMEREYGLNWHGNIKCNTKLFNDIFTQEMEQEIKNDYFDRVVTINSKSDGSYHIKGSCWFFNDYMLEDIVKIDKQDRIQSRFEILDI